MMKKYYFDYNLRPAFYKREDIQHRVNEKQIENHYISVSGLRTIFSDNKKHFFAYIKFFEADGEVYGIVGGKTNSVSCDFNFSKDKKYAPKFKPNARDFLRINQLEWHERILVLIPEKNTDEAACVLEKKLQEEFGLYGS